MTYTVTVDFFDIEAASAEQATAAMVEMLQVAGFTRFEVTGSREA
ncbi:MAG: hypothetical protein ACE5I9_01885 [Candidatus Methylomirabilales bacterium]